MQVVVVTVDLDGPVSVRCDGRVVWPPRDWMDEAPCRGLDPAIFMPPPGGDERATARNFIHAPDLVMQLCPTCPVRQQCERYGRVSRSAGWWGGVFLPIKPAPKKWHQAVASRPRALTLERERQLCERYAAGGVTQSELAREFGIGRTTVTRIVSTGPIAAAPVLVEPVKLTDEQRDEIRRRYIAGASGRTLAAEFGVSRSSIARLTSGLRPWTPALTEAQVAEVRRRWAERATKRTLAAEYGVDPKTIMRAVEGVQRD